MSALTAAAAGNGVTDSQIEEGGVIFGERSLIGKTFPK